MASPQAVSPAALATASANPSANASASGNAKSPTSVSHEDFSYTPQSSRTMDDRADAELNTDRASKPTAAEAASPISVPATPASPSNYHTALSNVSIAESSPQHSRRHPRQQKAPTIVSSPNPNQSAFPSAASHPKSIPETLASLLLLRTLIPPPMRPLVPPA
ncbi:hypothetical protein Pst134EA_031505 [Puccinia striiformis f. sp. tritici]|uniref:uncharacterized protein n=1 Tax=Puccinia striiformis f. sp. tritici TaxID=168172 RepID=UPI0020081F53|nr:uncharacterized protein Pst134EA_031505 [Puccinia striiformis f. sp. tritici]KAH9445280.1 hypothetical protein Pst134EA_031505 [Puccinia striiformis f. sp. tritici]